MVYDHGIEHLPPGEYHAGLEHELQARDADDRGRAHGTPARVVGDPDCGRAGADGLPGRRGGEGERGGREGVDLPDQRAALIVEQGDVGVSPEDVDDIEPAGIAEGVVVKLTLIGMRKCFGGVAQAGVAASRPPPSARSATRLTSRPIRRPMTTPPLRPALTGRR